MENLRSSSLQSSALNMWLAKLVNHSSSLHQCVRACVGFGFLGLSRDAGLLEFRSNRYFLDAIDIPLMPSDADLQAAQVSLESQARTLGWKEPWEELIVRCLHEFSGSSFSEELPEILRGHRMPVLDDTDWQFLDEQGYLVVENAIPIDLCERLGERLDTLAHFEAGSKKGGYFYGSGRMQRIYQLLGKDELFRDLLLHPTCDQVMSHMFYRPTYHDKYFLTSFHGNVLQPGAEPQIWHVDANVPDPLPAWIIRANSNYVIHDYTEENGATEIVPGSHKLLRKPDRGEAEGHSLKKIKMCAPKGSIVFWHGHLWHRSGANRSQANRAALLATYAASFFREVCMEENPYLYLNQSVANTLSPPLKRILGWDHGAKHYA